MQRKPCVLSGASAHTDFSHTPDSFGNDPSGCCDETCKREVRAGRRAVTCRKRSSLPTALTAVCHERCRPNSSSLSSNNQQEPFQLFSLSFPLSQTDPSAGSPAAVNQESMSRCVRPSSVSGGSRHRSAPFLYDAVVGNVSDL